MKMSNINDRCNLLLNYTIDPVNKSGLDKVTEHGEICFDYTTREFVVFDETYAYEVGRTHYPLCAYAMLETYGEEYL
jgi:hypothetical protein